MPTDANYRDEIVGMHAAMQDMYRAMDLAILDASNVLIRGETGVGKELVARAISKGTKRGNFVAVNCAAIPDSLLEAELYGHVRGAYTDGRIQRPGLFITADKGTIFLDEIGDMNLSLQAKLLRAVQYKEVRQVGSDKVTNIDVKIIAATNQDLEHLMGDGKFRKDLFYRFQTGVNIYVPPLRERKSDIPLLLSHFLRVYGTQLDLDIGGVSEEVTNNFLSYSWHGNVSELEGEVRHAVLTAKSNGLSGVVKKLGVDYFRKLGATTEPVYSESSSVARQTAGELPGLKEVGKQAARAAERALMLRTLETTRWNRAKTARLLHISYKSLIYKIQQMGLNNEG